MHVLSFPNCKPKLNRYSLETLLSKCTIFNSFPIRSIHLQMPTQFHRIDLNLRDALQFPDEEYFIIKNISIGALLQHTFITDFVRNGSLYAFSPENTIEYDNFITITSSGKLVLLLETKIAKCLSLRRESQHNPKKKFMPSHQTFVIDIKAPDFLPGTKLYETVSTELEKIEHIKFKLLLRWQPIGDVCSQSIRCYFKKMGFVCDVYEPIQEHSIFSGLHPVIDFSQFDEAMLDDVLYWIGTQSCGVEYSASEVETKEGNFQMSSTIGFFTEVQVCNMLKKIRAIFEKDSSLPFVTVFMRGYEDCCIISQGQHVLDSKEKIIFLLISPALDCWVVTLNRG